jgi:hypothetical protein
MAALSNYLESGILNHLFRGTGFPIPSNISIALTSQAPQKNQTGATITEVKRYQFGSSGDATGYSRMTISTSGNGNSKWNFALGSGIKNVEQIVFPTALKDWGPVSGVAILDSNQYGSGNLLMYSALTNPRNIYVSDTVRYSSEGLEIVLE